MVKEAKENVKEEKEKILNKSIEKIKREKM